MINIQSDSRKIKLNDTFVAVKCEVNDGHNYIEKAIEAGATKIIAEHGNYSVPTLIVEDSRKYLEDYLKQNYGKYLNEMTIIGITGTNGKTTSAYLIYQALNKLGIKTGYIGTIGFYLDKKIMSLPNTSVDICDTYNLLMEAYDKEYKIVVLEASSQALASVRLNTIEYDYALFTNLTQDHLDYHKTMENYALAKQILFKRLKTTGKAIVNQDDLYAKYYLLEKNNNITYGFDKATYKINNYNLDVNGTNFELEYKNNKLQLFTQLIGKYNLYNILSMISLLKEMNIEDNKLIDIIPTLESPSGRMEIIKYKNNSIVIDYAHTEDAIEKIITTVKQVVKGNIYVVFGCTGDRDRTKRSKMTSTVKKLSNYFIITNDDPHFEDPNQIVNDMTENLESNNYEICLDRKEAIKKGINLLSENDALFILGKGHEEYMIVGKDKIPFNDKKVVLDIIEKSN